MTVKELIQKLSLYEDDVKVYVSYYDDFTDDVYQTRPSYAVTQNKDDNGNAIVVVIN